MQGFLFTGLSLFLRQNLSVKRSPKISGAENFISGAELLSFWCRNQSFLVQKLNFLVQKFGRGLLIRFIMWEMAVGKGVVVLVIFNIA